MRKINENSYDKWDKTKSLFLSWIHKTKLRSMFSKQIKYENLSLWWVSDIVTKDIILNNQWYKDLNNFLNNEKLNKKRSNVFSLLKYLRKFLFTIIFSIFCKIFFPIKKYKNKFNNCFFYYERNLMQYKNFQVDRQYGFYQLKKKNSCCVIFLIPDLNTILNYKKKQNQFSKTYLMNSVLNSYVSIFDILNVYFKVFIYWMKLKNILAKRNYFFIKGMDCKNILQRSLEKSFFGKIQDELIYGLALKRYLNLNSSNKFFNYCEFFQYSRSFYHFAKSHDERIKIITINHAPFDKSILHFALNKNEFSKSTNHLMFSPKPDIFLTQGRYYANFLKKIFNFNKKIYPIGMLKSEFHMSVEKKKNILPIKKRISKGKKILSIFINVKDYINAIDLLKQIDLKKFIIILRPHPYLKDIRKKVTTEYKNNLNTKIIIRDDLSSKQIIELSDFILCGDSTTWVESLIYKKKNSKVFRISSSIEPPLFSKSKEIPILDSINQIEQFLNTKKNNLKVNKKKIIVEYMWSNDAKASERMIKLNL